MEDDRFLPGIRILVDKDLQLSIGLRMSWTNIEHDAANRGFTIKLGGKIRVHDCEDLIALLARHAFD
ncbi:hypothetical protein FQ154_11190 [Paeniglutamicibacter gangotriensis]|uniref:Uncharacterized protein n=1 Tax=Paeniglutamicibacter gangotriensis TaxID=254787 RepID=A0A5B0EBK9_9MICC|nr:hypothetical protein [Paeniglutamicibacter gangotriensis]KAA0976424.1 hypothetical protein FQ154_11190 [Paeniglutamicibacter gangotriensis]